MTPSNSTLYLFSRIQPLIIGCIAWTALALLGWFALNHELGKLEGVTGIAMGALLMLGMSAFKTQLAQGRGSRSSLLHDLVNGKNVPKD